MVPARPPRVEDRPALVIGGAGFIGTNLADHLLRQGRDVVVFDNLSRSGVADNLAFLRAVHGARVHLEIADVRNPVAVGGAVAGAGQVFHLAAQVAVTTSLVDPAHDFEVNARGTLNVLEGLRALPCPPPLVFTSTNKVYGGFRDLPLVRHDRRYEPKDAALRQHGISEARPLDFHSPYGCSKGTADQYILDYARTFSIPAVVFRMSCIYGPHQCGNEDQGWVAHFLRRALEGGEVTIYGDGRQVRDVLFIQDLVEALIRAQARMSTVAGRAFNIGGGPAHTVSLLELLDLIAQLRGRKCRVQRGRWRPGDQRYYVSDPRAFREATGWRPTVGVREGVTRLLRWLVESPARRSAPPPSIATPPLDDAFVSAPIRSDPSADVRAAAQP
jgi:CDP-paratose 2-epimerase